MRLKLLANTAEDGKLTVRQHFTCFVIDGGIAVDAGSLASGTSAEEKARIRDIVLTHAHLDHIAGLPLFLDDLFDKLERPVRIHATDEVIEILENDIFNWRVYPKFSELANRFGPVMEYVPVLPGVPFDIKGIKFEAVNVNHKVPAVGYIISGSDSVVVLTGDTAEMNGFWDRVNALDRLDALLIECAFPDRLTELAEVSHHLTPQLLSNELAKLAHADCAVFAINLKPMYMTETLEEIESLGISGLKVLDVGKEYGF